MYLLIEKPHLPEGVSNPRIKEVDYLAWPQSLFYYTILVKA